MICDRCSAQTAKPEKCNYCDKMVCRLCEKSSKKKKKTERYVICRTCWGDLKKRTIFKRT